MWSVAKKKLPTNPGLHTKQLLNFELSRDVLNQSIKKCFYNIIFHPPHLTPMQPLLVRVSRAEMAMYTSKPPVVYQHVGIFLLCECVI